jgi:transcriptional regulator with XRE-family HTH domain
MAQKESLLVTEKELKKIGMRLKGLRKAKGYSNPDKFAYEHNLNRSQYGKYEAGTTNITIATLINILNHFDMALNDFFNDEYSHLS